MIRLYDTEPSGSCHKVRLLLSLLGLDHELVPVDFHGGEHRTPAFRKINPFGEIPVLVDGAITLRDSQSILVYLARRYGDESWLPLQPEAMARVMQWLSVAGNEIQNGPNPARRAVVFGRKFDLAAAQKASHRLLTVMDAHLRDRDWLAADHPTIADIACYPYLAVVPEGSVDLTPYPNVRAWIDQIESLPNAVPMPRQPAPTPD